MSKREFELACSVLPPDFCWGEPVTPELVLHIIGAATPSAQSSQQGAVAWRTTEPFVCVPVTEDSSVAEMWRDAGYDVIDLFEHDMTQHRPSDDSLWDQTLQERDHYHEWADKLADAIALHLDIDIGEHSSANNPWNEALDAIMATPSVAELSAHPHATESDRRDAWQPIETAPKDGTPVILFARAKNATASAPVIGWWLPDMGWIESAFSPNHPVGIVPSHWMPRPDFPSQTPAPGGE